MKNITAIVCHCSQVAKDSSARRNAHPQAKEDPVPSSEQFAFPHLEPKYWLSQEKVHSQA